MKKQLSIFIPIYGHNILVGYDTNGDDFVRYFKKRLKKDYVSILLDAKDRIDDFYKDKTRNAYFMHHDASGLAIILLRKDNDDISFQSRVLHEVCHFCFWLLDKRGLPLTLQTDESYTYLISFVYEEIMKGLKQN